MPLSFSLLLGRLVCWRKGHKRGKRVECQSNGTVKVFACPRCGRRTKYKADQQPA